MRRRGRPSPCCAPSAATTTRALPILTGRLAGADSPRTILLCGATVVLGLVNGRAHIDCNSMDVLTMCPPPPHSLECSLLLLRIKTGLTRVSEIKKVARWDSSASVGGLAFPITAARMAYSRVTRATAVNRAESMQKSADTASPALTSAPTVEIAEGELLEKNYTLPSDICGWTVGIECKYPATLSHPFQRWLKHWSDHSLRSSRSLLCFRKSVVYQHRQLSRLLPRPD